jgi:hypothetical protein
MISTTSEVLDPIGSQRLGMASSDTATITELPASSTGMPAAISAPNTAMSRMSVIGTEVSSALRKSWPISVLAARSVLASPASVTRTPGWRAWTRATAARSVPTAVSAREFGPATWKVTRALRPLADTRAWLPRAQRGPDVPGCRGQLVQRADHAGDRAVHRRVMGVARRAGPGLDQHALGGRADHAELVQGLLGLAGLAGVVLRLALRAEQLPGDQRCPAQDQPAADHGDPVPCAPAGDPLDPGGR